MPNQHKRPPLALRLPEGLEAWYRDEAARRKMALNALAVEALQAYRGGNTPEPQKPEAPRTVLGYSKERQTRGRR